MTAQFQTPHFRLPLLYKGDFQYVPITHFRGQPTILCCLSTISERDTWVLEAHASELSKSGITLVLLLSPAFPLTDTWSRPIEEFGLPIFGDPLKRFRRTLHLFRRSPSHRCESLVFDHQSQLKFRFNHDLNLRGFSAVLEAAKIDLEHSAFSPSGIQRHCSNIHHFPAVRTHSPPSGSLRKNGFQGFDPKIPEHGP